MREIGKCWAKSSRDLRGRWVNNDILSKLNLLDFGKLQRNLLFFMSVMIISQIL